VMETAKCLKKSTKERSNHMQPGLFDSRDAVLSDDGRYRYRLSRRWTEGPTLHWVMLNPSTADADKDDPTIRRCVGFATHNGFGSISVCNLFALRATNPRELIPACSAAVGPANDKFIQEIPSGSTVVAAWGAFLTTTSGAAGASTG
jgi:hypothetical protein